MMTRILAKGYLWFLLALLYSPILIIMIFSFTEAKVLGNWTGFSTKLYSSLFTGGMHHSLMNAIWNTFAIATIAATASTLLGSLAAIGIFNLRSRARQVMNFTNAIPMMNADIFACLLFVPGRKFGEDFFVDVICPVVYFQYTAALLTGTGTGGKEKNAEEEGYVFLHCL